MKSLKSIVTALVFLVLAATTFAGNGAVQLREVPLGIALANPCTAEVITVAGTGHVVLRGDDANHHLDMRNAIGVGNTGRIYRQRGATIENFQGSPEGTQSFTFRLKLVSDDGHSLLFSVAYHLQLDANGDVIVEHEILRYECT